MGDSYVLICRDLKEDDKLRGAPTIIANLYRHKKTSASNLTLDVPQEKVQDMQKVASMINNLLSIFGFTYLAMNKTR